MVHFSIIVPAYNEEALIGQCVDSIIREFKNCNRGWEIIVVDNGSTDNTAVIAQEKGCKIIHCDKKGVTRARQAGFENSLGDIVIFIDADNVLPSGWFWFMYCALAREDVVAVSGPVVFYDLPKYQRVVTFCFYTVAKIFHIFMPMMQGGNFVVKRDALKAAGGFNTAIDFYGEDTDTAIRMSKQGKVAFDLDMYAYSSGRRMQSEGLLLTGFRYIANYIWMWIFKKPFTARYNDIRIQ